MGGEEIIKKSDNTMSWLCGLCKEVGKIHLYSSTSTAWMDEHLTKRHNLSKPTTTESHLSLASQIESTSPVIKGNTRSPFIAITPKQYSKFRLMLITWMIKKHISYSQVEDETFREFVASCSMGAISAESILPRSGNTIRNWIMEEYKKQKLYLDEVILRQACSSVHISFDLWTTSNNTAYVDVICHFIDAKRQLRTLLLAVRDIKGDPSGKNQARSIIPVLEEYSLKEKLGYFITDNASSNDTCVTEIIETLRPDLDANNQRLRCMGHIINLIAKAFLFGNRSETFGADIAVAEGVSDLEGAMKLGRKQGAIGKLHNLIRFIRASPQREELFMDLVEAIPSTQDELSEKTKRLHVIDDNRTRWNSTYLMINRDLRLRRRIEKFYSTKFSKEKDFRTGDNLSETDWDELEIFKNLLHPFYHLTMRLQGNSRTGSHGSAWECLVAIDIIREHLKKAKAEHLKGRHTGFLGTAINTGLSLAQKYYKLITENPVYAAAVVLNPTQKWNYFDAKWTEKEKRLQVASYKETLQDTWVTQYSSILPEPPQSPSSRRVSLDIFDQFLTSDGAVDIEVIASDKYTQYCTKPRDSILSTLPPFQWWLQHENEYPELTKWALNVHSIPATSAECERVFSSTGQFLTPRRNRLLDDVVEANEFLMAWKKSGLF